MTAMQPEGESSSSGYGSACQRSSCSYISNTSHQAAVALERGSMHVQQWQQLG